VVPGEMEAILNRVVFPQRFMLPCFKMYLVKLKGDEEMQERHLNVISKNIPSGKTGFRRAGRNRGEPTIITVAWRP
jgi:hypothetical protein